MADIWQWKGDESTGAGLVNFTGSGTVAVSGTATVNFSGSGTVVISGTSTVNFSGSGTVSLTGSATVILTGTSTVTFSGSETVAITGTSTVNFSGSGTVAISGSLTLSNMLNSAGDTIPMNDYITGSFPTIDTDHKYIHEGLFFETYVQATLTSGGTYNIVLTTPPTLYMHYRPAKISCSADKLTISLYEGSSSTAGVTVTPYNHHRISTAVATMTVVQTASVTSDGTLIMKSFIGGGSGIGGARQGAETGAANEWILKQSTNYCLRLTNGSTGSNTVNINNVWYEETKN